MSCSRVRPTTPPSRTARSSASSCPPRPRFCSCSQRCRCSCRESDLVWPIAFALLLHARCRGRRSLRPSSHSVSFLSPPRAQSGRRRARTPMIQVRRVANPVDGGIGLRADVKGRTVMLTWRAPGTAGVSTFYKLVRATGPTDVRCDIRARSGRRVPGQYSAASHSSQHFSRGPTRTGHVDVSRRRRGQLPERPHPGGRLPGQPAGHGHGSVVVRRHWGEALGLTVLLALAGILFARSLHTQANFDEGVYLASLDALRHGQALGTVVDVPQPPGFYVLLQAFGSIFGHAVADIRIGFLLVALIGLAAAFFVGRSVSGAAGGLAAAGLLAVTAPYPSQAATVEADTVSTVLALAAVAFLIGRRAGRPHAAAAGALGAAAVSVKLLALPVAAPLAVLLIARRSGRLAVAFAAGAGGRCRSARHPLCVRARGAMAQRRRRAPKCAVTGQLRLERPPRAPASPRLAHAGRSPAPDRNRVRRSLCSRSGDGGARRVDHRLRRVPDLPEASTRPPPGAAGHGACGHSRRGFRRSGRPPAATRARRSAPHSWRS